MRYRDFLAEIVQEQTERGLEPHDVTAGEIITWILDNRKLEDLISVVKDDTITEIPLRRKYKDKATLNRIQNADIIVGLANLLVERRHFAEAEEIFREILARTPYETTALNDYGLLLLKNGREVNGSIIITKENLELAKTKIFLATEIDRCLHEDPHLMPAYKNICFTRYIEASIFLNNKEAFTAFVLAWMSIEMSIYRIWYKFLKNFPSSKEKVDSLMKWNIEPILETCYLAHVNPELSVLKTDLDTLRGIRNGLLHGNINDVTLGHAERCIKIAQRVSSIN